MLRHVLRAAALCAAISAADLAAAATVTFDLTGGADPAAPSEAQYAALDSGFTLSAGGLTMEVTARSYSFIMAYGIGDGTIAIDDAYGVSDQKLGRFAGGLGVFTGATDPHLMESDPRDVFEYIRLSFNRPVTLGELGFSGFADGDDNYVIIRDLNGDGVLGAGDNIGEDRAVGASVASGATDSLGMWGVLATGPFSEFLLSSVSVSYDEAAPVPLPAPALMLIAGLAGLAGLRRRA